MPTFTDQTGHTIEFAIPPKRIISLVPSQTELLYDLGLNTEVIGITKFCVHPTAWFQTKPRVGGTKQLHLDRIRYLKPDLIIANKEENVREQIIELADSYPVWTSDVSDLSTAFDMIRSIGAITEKQRQADRIVTEIQNGFARLASIPALNELTSYLIWRDPYMTVGGDTFIHAMLSASGFQNIFQSKSRYPETDPAELLRSGCELLLLPSEPFPFGEKHKLELQEYLLGVKIMLVDGEMFSWYGSRLIKAANYFADLRLKLAAQM
jgi:ABC-type Fe3+-hydroxamate transport system substrate-binding protein